MVVTFSVRVTKVDGHATVRPVVGPTEPKLTVPAKLFRLVRLTVTSMLVVPMLKLTWPGAEIWKSPT